MALPLIPFIIGAAASAGGTALSRGSQRAQAGRASEQERAQQILAVQSAKQNQPMSTERMLAMLQAQNAQGGLGNSAMNDAPPTGAASQAQGAANPMQGAAFQAPQGQQIPPIAQLLMAMRQQQGGPHG